MADVNGDGLLDIYVCYSGKPQTAFEIDKESEDADAVFFDANGDGFQDLYVVSGGYHSFSPNDSRLQDRLYLNDGGGNFKKMENALPEMLSSKSCVRVSDINSDGYPDLFVGGRVVPGRYPEVPESAILINDGEGHFTNQTKSIAPALERMGMVTDASWIDINKDGNPDLIVVGEWMPVMIWINNKGKLEDKTSVFCEKPLYGWWNKLLDQISTMRTRYPDYKSYADQTLADIFDRDELKDAAYFKANCLSTTYFELSESGRFEIRSLPVIVQSSPIFTINTLDFDNDGYQDLLLCGNINQARLRFGKYDANLGILLKGNGKGGFEYIPQWKSGFTLWGDVRNVLSINDIWLFGINQDSIKAYKQNK